MTSHSVGIDQQNFGLKTSGHVVISRMQPLKQRRLFSLCLIAVCLWVSTPVLVYGEAFRILDQGAAGSGQATAFAAQADDASAVFYNPAGMTQLRGVQLSGGLLLVGGKVTVQSQSGQNVRGNFGGTVVTPPPMHAYMTAHLPDLGVDWIDGLTLGLGLNTPFGLLIEYPKTAPFSTVLTQAALPVFDIKPTIAFNLNDYIALGVGLDVYTFANFVGEGGAEGQRTAGAAFAAIGITPGSQLEFNGDDTAFGFNLSTLFTPLRNTRGEPLLAFAFIYRSHTSLNLRGTFLDDGARFDDALVELNLPDVYTAGFAWWPIRERDRDWKVEVDVDYADWSEFQDLDVQLASGIVLPRPRQWGDAFVVRVGSAYTWHEPMLLPHWTVALRGGYLFSETPVPNTTFEPAVPDADYHAFSVGLGFGCHRQGKFFGLIPCAASSSDAASFQRITIDLAYKIRLYEERNITNNRSAVVNGRWDTVMHAGMVTLGWAF